MDTVGLIVCDLTGPVTVKEKLSVLEVLRVAVRASAVTVADKVGRVVESVSVSIGVPECVALLALVAETVMFIEADTLRVADAVAVHLAVGVSRECETAKVTVGNVRVSLKDDVSEALPVYSAESVLVFCTEGVKDCVASSVAVPRLRVTALVFDGSDKDSELVELYVDVLIGSGVIDRLLESVHEALEVLRLVIEEVPVALGSVETVRPDKEMVLEESALTVADNVFSRENDTDDERVTLPVMDDEADRVKLACDQDFDSVGVAERVASVVEVKEKDKLGVRLVSVSETVLVAELVLRVGETPSVTKWYDRDHEGTWLPDLVKVQLSLTDSEGRLSVT
jgi:hypothetical protein